MFKLIAKLFYTVLLIIETFIAVRFVLRLIEAEPTNFFIKGVYDVSGLFLRPIEGIVPDLIYIQGLAVDSTALLGLLIYMILAFIAIELIKTFS